MTDGQGPGDAIDGIVGDDPGLWSVTDPRIFADAELHETPVIARARLRRIGNLVSQARNAVKVERRRMVAADVAHRAAVRRAHLEGPRVDPRAGWSVDHKRAYVEDKTADEYLAWQLAVAAYEAAKEYLRTLDSQGMMAQSLLKSIDLAFRNVHSGEEGR